MIVRAISAAVLLARSVMPGLAGPLYQEEFRIPFAAARPAGIEALLVRPNEPGRYPLALITHGSPRLSADRPTMTPLAMLPQAVEFARRGFAAVVVMRRGYGGSGGGWAENYGGCADPNYVGAGSAAAADLKVAAEFVVRRADIDAARMIAVGVSAGGFAVAALTADPPAGLTAAIDFAGGRGSLEDGQVCNEERLADAYHFFGERSRAPMLWVYAQNDHFFGPQVAARLREAFVAGGGMVDFVAAPPFGSDGHGLFSPAGIPVWTGMVDTFLERQKLTLRATPLVVPRPALPAPRHLSVNGRGAFESYIVGAPHKAFAVAPDGHFGWRSGQRTSEAARSGALEFCRQGGGGCAVVFVDDAVATNSSLAR